MLFIFLEVCDDFKYQLFFFGRVSSINFTVKKKEKYQLYFTMTIGIGSRFRIIVQLTTTLEILCGHCDLEINVH
jgi:hypothetical protein